MFDDQKIVTCAFGNLQDALIRRAFHPLDGNLFIEAAGQKCYSLSVLVANQNAGIQYHFHQRKVRADPV